MIVLCEFFSLVFSIVKYYSKLVFLRVKTPKRAWEAVLNVRGPVTTYIEVRGGGWWWESKFGCSLFLAVDNCQITEPLMSRVMFINFKPLKSTFLLLSVIAHAESTTRGLQIMILHCGFL